MKKEKVSISGLYYNYGNVDDANIRKCLNNIKIVIQKKTGNKTQYYPLTDKFLKKVSKKPRNFSIRFDPTISKDAITGLEKYKTITYLVKSSSRFILKPDIGEVFDQIRFDELYCDKLKAISLNEGYELLPDTQGEHFIMTATLLTTIKK
jgi:hypothetical protein